MFENDVTLPEGMRIVREDNRTVCGDVRLLREAMRERWILEAPAVRATAEMDLEVDLGAAGIGVIPRAETVLLAEGEAFKEIAVIGKVGRAVCFTVIGEEETDGKPRFLLSRRTAQWIAKTEYLDTLVRGDILTCRVTHSEHYGAFCDVACGNFALLPIDAISISRLPHPSARVSVGETLRVAVRGRDAAGRLFLTRRELCGTWEENAALFAVGQTVTGIVRSVEPYGVFIELTPNLAGLAESCDDLAVGQNVSVYIKSILPEKAKVKLVVVDRRPAIAVPCRVPPFAIEKESHVDEWHYSPAACKKQINTIFTEKY